MEKSTRLSDLYVRNWKLLLFSFFLPALVAIPFIIIAGLGREGGMLLAMVGMAAVVCATAFFLASVQQEMMSRAFTFLLPGLRRGMMRHHYVAVALLSAAVMVAVLTLPAFAGLVGFRLGLAWSAACFLALVYGLTLLTVYYFPFSSWLPFNAAWMIFLIIRLWVHTPPESLAQVLDHPALLTVLAALAGLAVHSRLTRPALHRRLLEQPYISLVDLKNQTKIEQFKQARNRHKVKLEKETRPGSALIRSLLEKVARHQAVGQRSRAVAGEAMAALLMTSIPRSRIRGILLALFLPLMVLWLGYWDGRLSADPDDPTMAGWFPGFAFMGLYWTAQAFHFVKTRPMGLLRSRRDMHRAGWLTIALLLVQTLAFSAVVWLMFAAGHAWLPPITLAGCTQSFTLPPAHAPLLPLFYLPVQLLIYIRWPMKGTFMVLQQTGTLAFFAFHGLLLWGNEPVQLAAVAVAALCWLALPLVWRWRVFRTDLA